MEYANEAGELFGYVRFGICVSAMLLSVIGYLSCGGFDAGLALAASSGFMFAAACYGYNNSKDREEDALNGRGTNSYAAARKGTYVIYSCFLIGAASSAALGAQAVVIYLLLSFLAWFYSHYRIKKHIFIKNVYTSLSLAALYLLGASAAGSSVKAGVLETYAFVAGFVFVGTVIGDLRDVKGDLAAGIKTFSGALGETRSKKVVYIFILLLSLQIAAYRLGAFYATLPFFLPVALLVKKELYAQSHKWYVRSFIFAACWSGLTAAQII